MNNLFQRANQVIPGGVNSPVRSFRSVGIEPIFVQRAKGAMVVDTNDNEYIDYIGSWGTMIFGHSFSPVIESISQHIASGTSYGLPTGLEVDLAEKICANIPSIEMVRLTVSGTEATMSAIRLARAYTKRNKIIKFAGCYHGHSDSLLCGEVGSGVLTNNIPDSNGIPQDVIQNTTTLDFGDLEGVQNLLRSHEYAAVILEPIPANMGLILTDKSFLQGLRDICDQTDTLLIFDEVITGFRLSIGGVQALYDITPDLTTLGKIIGGGFPIGAFGGKKEIMSMIAPMGSVYHAGTLSGNPIATRAGLVTLTQLETHKNSLYTQLNSQAQLLAQTIRDSAQKHNIPVQVHQLESLYTVFFTDQVVQTLSDAKTCDTERYARYFRSMLKRGILLPMSQFEVNFISTAHNDDIIARTIVAIQESFRELSDG